MSGVIRLNSLDEFQSELVHDDLQEGRLYRYVCRYVQVEDKRFAHVGYKALDATVDLTNKKIALGTLPHSNSDTKNAFSFGNMLSTLGDLAQVHDIVLVRKINSPEQIAESINKVKIIDKKSRICTFFVVGHGSLNAIELSSQSSLSVQWLDSHPQLEEKLSDSLKLLETNARVVLYSCGVANGLGWRIFSLIGSRSLYASTSDVYGFEVDLKGDVSMPNMVTFRKDESPKSFMDFSWSSKIFSLIRRIFEDCRSKSRVLTQN